MCITWRQYLSRCHTDSYTPVATGSMRKLLRTGEILTPRDADDGGSKAWRGSGEGPPIPGVFVRVGRKGVKRHGGRQSGKQRTYREAVLRLGATDEDSNGY